jgi:hypothetical protein
VRRLPILILIALCGACAAEPPVDTSSSGAPSIDVATVREHAGQFEEEVPVRDPGSQEELAAASYILGHLQQAGYVPLLDAVPVGDLVESTNVVAMPPGGGSPTFLVAVSYGASKGTTTAEAIGTFLELARALNVKAPDHRVGFVALGAEESPRLGSALGTLRLLQYLEDEELEPHIITLAPGSRLEVTGPAAEGIEEASEASSAPRDDLFARAGLEHSTVAGPPRAVGEALLDFLDD